MDNSAAEIFLGAVSRTEAVTTVPAKKGQELDGEYMGSVVLSGVSIVFIALILLIFFVWLMDKVFNLVKGSKKKNKSAEVSQKAPAPANPAAVVSEKPPVTEDGIPEEVVAAVAAAVAMLGEETGRTLKITGISKKGGGSSRRGRWGDAAASENTRSLI